MKIKSNVPALDRALDIIDYLAINENSTIKEMSTQLSIPIVSVYRMLEILVRRGYVKEIRRAETEYRLGSKIIDIARILDDNAHIASVARPFMKKLSLVTGQTSQLGVLTSGGVQYIAQEMPDRPINIIAGLYLEMGVNVSASGKILLAAMTDDLRTDFINRIKLEQRTEYTITDRNLYLKELEIVKQQQYAVDKQEYAIGIGCCAVPVINKAGVTVAALGLTGHWTDYSQAKQITKLLAEMTKYAELIGEHI